MKRIVKISFVIVFCMLSTSVFSQMDVLNPKHFKDKQPAQFYDEQNMRLHFANDTLRLYITGDKKIEIAAVDIASSGIVNGWPTFAADIEDFSLLINQLQLDLESNNYHFTFNPASAELQVEQVFKSEYKAIGEELLPTYRHKVSFSYPADLTQVVFYLGEIDELNVLKAADVASLIADQNKSYEWRDNYQKRRFNKSIQIAENGDLNIKTFSNEESHEFISMDYDIGVGITAGFANFSADTKVHFHLLGKKTSAFDHRIFLLVHFPVFYESNEQGSFDELPQLFTGLGFSTNATGRRSSVAIAQNIVSSTTVLSNYNTVLRFDYAFHPQFNLIWNSYFDWSTDSNINALGVSFRLINLSYVR